MKESEVTRNCVLGATLFLAVLVVTTNFHVKKRAFELFARHDALVTQIAQPLPTAARDVEQDIVQRHRRHENKFKMACAVLLLPYEHQGPINGEIIPNRTLQMECEYKGEGDIIDAQTTDPYYTDDDDVTDQT